MEEVPLVQVERDGRFGISIADEKLACNSSCISTAFAFYRRRSGEVWVVSRVPPCWSRRSVVPGMEWGLRQMSAGLSNTQIK